MSDLASKVSHGVLFTMDRLVSFGYNHLPSCFCGFRLELVEHLFFNCALAKSGIDWIQSLLYWSAPLAPSILLCHVLFGFSPDELLVVPRVFVYLLHVLKFLIWNQRNDFRFRSIRPGAVSLLASVLSPFVLQALCFSLLQTIFPLSVGCQWSDLLPS